MGIKQVVVSSAKKPMMWALKFLIKILLIIGLLAGLAVGTAYGLDTLGTWLVELVSTAWQDIKER